MPFKSSGQLSDGTEFYLPSTKEQNSYPAQVRAMASVFEDSFNANNLRRLAALPLEISQLSREFAVHIQNAVEERRQRLQQGAPITASDPILIRLDARSFPYIRNSSHLTRIIEVLRSKGFTVRLVDSNTMENISSIPEDLQPLVIMISF